LTPKSAYADADPGNADSMATTAIDDQVEDCEMIERASSTVPAVDQGPDSGSNMIID
jgi:hypothetical protein